MQHPIRTLVLVLVGSIGCVGGIESGGVQPPAQPEKGDDGNDNGDNPAGGDLTAAKQVFDQKVWPVIQKCSGGACHGEAATGATLTRFVAGAADRGWQVATNYTALVGNFAPSAAPILTYVKPGHQGLTWSDAETTAITEWLTKEVELRNGQTTPPPSGTETLSQATKRVIEEFNGCMALEDFTEVNFGQAYANSGSDEGPCRNCHVTGGEGFMASPSAQQMFDVHTTRQMFFLQYFTVDLTQGAAMATVKVNETSFRGVATGQDPHRDHPRFNALDNNGMIQLRAFYDRIMAKKAAGGCGAKRAFTF